MARKGLSTTLVLIVTIVVLLIVALVLLTIFGGTVQSVAGLAQAKSVCTVMNSGTCTGTGPTCPAVFGSVYDTTTSQVVTCSSMCTCAVTGGSCQFTCS